MVCVPIITTPGVPFGVVCFHNNNPDGEFSESEVEALKSYVDVLAIALHNPLPELNLEKNVFIVHGRDEATRQQLELILLKYDVKPKVLVKSNTGPNSILEELEALIRICKAGFILVTPDDEGRLRDSTDSAVGRARQNVIFETGLLFAKFRKFERVALVVRRPIELPSDLDGILFLKFEKSVNELEVQIVEKLNGWGIPTRTSH
jgi:predicted nucleotide-binding protein